MTRGERLMVDGEKAVAGGRILARHDGAIVLVAGAIPGERVEVEVEKVQRGTVWAAVRTVLEASPDRVDPFCDPECGGSVFAHVRYERQLGLKREMLRDAFARLGRLALDDDVPVVASPPEAYRLRARLHVRDGRVGFFREGTHALCDAAATRQLRGDTLDTIVRLGDALRGAARARVLEVEVSENRDASERACHLVLAHDGDPSRLAAVTRVEGLSGASCAHGQHSRTLALWGSPFVSDAIAGVRLTRHARAFFQGNRFLVETLATRVRDAVAPGAVLDLYAGVGLFGAVLAARGDTTVAAVEGDAIAADDLKRNLAAFGSAATAWQQAVEKFLGSRRGRQPVGTVVVDPPRSGMARGAVEAVVRLGAPRLVYVSCDVATLARDARLLCDAGYRLKSVEVFDMFPNTAHVETVVVCDRVGAGPDS